MSSGQSRTQSRQRRPSEKMNQQRESLIMRCSHVLIWFHPLVAEKQEAAERRARDAEKAERRRQRQIRDQEDENWNADGNGGEDDDEGEMYSDADQEMQVITSLLDPIFQRANGWPVHSLPLAKCPQNHQL